MTWGCTQVPFCKTEILSPFWMFVQTLQVSEEPAGALQLAVEQVVDCIRALDAQVLALYTVVVEGYLAGS